MLALLLNLGFAGGGAYVPPVVEETTDNPTGGYYPSPRYKTAEEKRKERIRLGIIPDDKPELLKKAIAKAAESPQPIVSARKLAKQYDDNTKEIERLVRALRKAYREAEKEARAEYLADADKIRLFLEGEIIEQRKRNNAAVALLMLGSM